MAVHSFASIGEIYAAPNEEKRQAVRDTVLKESRIFDTRVRNAVGKRDAAERKKELLALESLYEFKRSHPTVEVRPDSLPSCLRRTDESPLALHTDSGSGRSSRTCKCRTVRS